MLATLADLMFLIETASSHAYSTPIKNTSYTMILINQIKENYLYDT